MPAGGRIIKPVDSPEADILQGRVVIEVEFVCCAVLRDEGEASNLSI